VQTQQIHRQSNITEMTEHFFQSVLQTLITTFTCSVLSEVTSIRTWLPNVNFWEKNWAGQIPLLWDPKQHVTVLKGGIHNSGLNDIHQ